MLLRNYFTRVTAEASLRHLKVCGTLLPISTLKDIHMDVRAAIAIEPGQPLAIEMVRLEGPRSGEVLVEITATGICHTDAYTLAGFDSEGIFPSILGHEGAGIVREIGAGVPSVTPGDPVIPLYA